MYYDSLEMLLDVVVSYFKMHFGCSLRTNAYYDLFEIFLGCSMEFGDLSFIWIMRFSLMPSVAK
jgi:hypothetical protein